MQIFPSCNLAQLTKYSLDVGKRRRMARGSRGDPQAIRIKDSSITEVFDNMVACFRVTSTASNAIPKAPSPIPRTNTRNRSCQPGSIIMQLAVHTKKWSTNITNPSRIPDSWYPSFQFPTQLMSSWHWLWLYCKYSLFCVLGMVLL